MREKVIQQLCGGNKSFTSEKSALKRLVKFRNVENNRLVRRRKRATGARFGPVYRAIIGGRWMECLRGVGIVVQYLQKEELFLVRLSRKQSSLVAKQT
jgi:hypothetical protein